MAISRTLALLFLLCWLVTGCNQLPLLPTTEAVAVAPTMAPPVTPPPHAYSPILVPTSTPIATMVLTSSSPITTVVAIDFSGASAITRLTWQGDTLITGYTEGQPEREYLKLTPTTELWQRDRISINDLQVGDWVTVFGTSTGYVGLTDYMVILPNLSAAFTKTGEYTNDHLAIGEIASITPDESEILVTIALVDNALPIRAATETRVFRQHAVTLAALEEESFISYIGTILRSGEKTLFEVDRAVILHTPSQYTTEEFPLICVTTNGTAHCRDEYLGIEFDHPASWGKSIGTLGRSRYVGFSYEYRFENPEVIAGGRSHHFMEPRDGFFTDFGGTDGRPLAERCATPDVMLCETIQPGVELKIRRSSGEALCRPGPGMIGRPTVFITVDLPDHTRINGLLFATGFLSTALTEELAPLEPQPYPAQSAPKNCDEASLLRYEERMQRLAQQIRDNSLDAETQANLQTLRNMAASFRGQALPDQ